jgi:hypothetical protein
MAGFARRVEPEQLSMFLARQRIAIVGIAALHELGFAELAEDLGRRLKTGMDRARSLAQIQSVLTSELLAELDSCSVHAVPLKGVVLAQRLYDDPAGRESKDIDVLVAPDQLDEAVRIIRRRFGYEAPVDAVDSSGRPLLHYRLIHPRGWPSVEVHWRVHWYEGRSGAAMVGASARVDGVWRLRTVDELVCLLLFYARDAFIGLRNLVAVAAWWDRFGDELPAHALSAFVTEFPELRPALATSLTLATTLTGVPCCELARRPGALGLRQRSAARMADIEADRTRTELEADVGLADLLLSPRSDLKTFLRRQKLLNASFVAEHEDGQDGRSRWHRAFMGPRMLRRGTRLLRALGRTLLAGRRGGPAARIGPPR